MLSYTTFWDTTAKCPQKAIEFEITQQISTLIGAHGCCNLMLAWKELRARMYPVQHELFARPLQSIFQSAEAYVDTRDRANNVHDVLLVTQDIASCDSTFLMLLYILIHTDLYIFMRNIYLFALPATC